MNRFKMALAFADWRLRRYFAFLGNEERWANGAALSIMIVVAFVAMATMLHAVEMLLGRRLMLPSLGIWLAASLALSYLLLAALSRLLREDGVWSAKPLYDFHGCSDRRRIVGSAVLLALLAAVIAVYLVLTHLAGQLPR